MKSKYRWIGMFWVFLVPFLFSCATTVPLKRVVQDEGATSFLLAYDLKGMGGQEKCSLALVQPGSRGRYSIPLDASKNIVEFEIPKPVDSNEWRAECLICKESGHWELNQFGMKNLTAYPGKVGFLGRFGMHLPAASASAPDKAPALEIVRGNREETRGALEVYSKTRPASWNERLVSAYDGKSWEPHGVTYKRGIVSHRNGPKVQLRAIDWSACESVEFASNPVPLGVLSYHVTYENDRFKSMKKVKDHYSFSGQYVECVENAIKNFEPGVAGLITYDMSL